MEVVSLIYMILTILTLWTLIVLLVSIIKILNKIMKLVGSSRFVAANLAADQHKGPLLDPIVPGKDYTRPLGVDPAKWNPPKQ